MKLKSAPITELTDCSSSQSTFEKLFEEFFSQTNKPNLKEAINYDLKLVNSKPAVFSVACYSSAVDEHIDGMDKSQQS